MKRACELYANLYSEARDEFERLDPTAVDFDYHKMWRILTLLQRPRYLKEISEGVPERQAGDRVKSRLRTILKRAVAACAVPDREDRGQAQQAPERTPWQKKEG